MTCALAALMFVVLLCACSPEPTEVAMTESLSGPDLVIQSFQITESDWFLGVFKATAEVVVKNVGNQPAFDFNVVIVGVNREDKHVRFGFSYEPTLTAELTPGQEVTLQGETGLPWHGHFDVKCSHDEYDATLCAMRDENTLWLLATADYCEGDDGPDHCAVEELDETNNEMGPVIVEKASE